MPSLRRQLAAFVVLSLAACLSVIGGSSSAASPIASCARPDSRTIAETARVRLWSVPERYQAGRTVRGCWRPTGRAFPIADEYGCDPTGSGCGGARHFRLAGTVLAFDLSFSDHYSNSSYEVVVMDVRRGRRRREVGTGPLTHEQAHPDDESFQRHVGVGPVTALVVRPDGAVAWIARDYYAKAPSSYVVRALSGAHSVSLAAGGDIAPRSLRLDGRRVSWTQNGTRRSAPLARAD